MQSTDRDVLAGRLFVLSAALQEVVRALAPAQKGAVSSALVARVDTLMRAQPVTSDVDAGIAGELAALLAALRDTPE